MTIIFYVLKEYLNKLKIFRKKNLLIFIHFIYITNYSKITNYKLNYKYYSKINFELIFDLFCFISL